MLRAKAGNLYLFGLSDETMQQLRSGEPIVVALGEIGGPAVSIALYHGATRDDCVRKLGEIALDRQPRAGGER